MQVKSKPFRIHFRKIFILKSNNKFTLATTLVVPKLVNFNVCYMFTPRPNIIYVHVWGSPTLPLESVRAFVWAGAL